MFRTIYVEVLKYHEYWKTFLHNRILCYRSTAFRHGQINFPVMELLTSLESGEAGEGHLQLLKLSS